MLAILGGDLEDWTFGLYLCMDSTELITHIRDAAYTVRLALGPGFLESVYQNALLVELRARGIQAEKEIPIGVYYNNIQVGDFRVDILVECKVILEIKAVRELLPVHEAQLVNYLNATKIDTGFLINYGGDKFRIMKKTRIYGNPKP